MHSMLFLRRHWDTELLILLSTLSFCFFFSGIPKFILISVHDYNLPSFLLSSGYFTGKRKAESEVLSKYPNSGNYSTPFIRFDCQIHLLCLNNTKFVTEFLETRNPGCKLKQLENHWVDLKVEYAYQHILYFSKNMHMVLSINQGPGVGFMGDAFCF